MLLLLFLYYFCLFMVFLFIDCVHVVTLTRTVYHEIVRGVISFSIRLTCVSSLRQLRTCMNRRKVKETPMTKGPHRVTFPVQIFLQRTGSRKVPVKENCHVYHQRIIKFRRHTATNNSSNTHKMYVCMYVCGSFFTTDCPNQPHAQKKHLLC